jgi:lipopolysaccharide biosynthesis glycosyltransferase
MVPSTGDGNAAAADAGGTMHVAAASDDGYACHLAVMLLSLFAQHDPDTIHVHVLVPPDFTSRARLDQSLGAHAARLTYHTVPPGLGQDLVQRDDLTAATYYRLVMGDVLPREVERVLYLDCDMVVRAGLQALWQTALDGCVLAAVRDPGFREHATLGLEAEAPYFNAGMLLVDLARWRAEGIGAQALAFAAAEPGRLTYNDQCALNWVLRGRWREVEAEWNLQAQALCDVEDGDRALYFRPPPPALARARIIHFNAPCRPWLYMDEHPLKGEYLAYRARTEWRDWTPPDRYRGNIVLKMLRRHAPLLVPAFLWLRRAS